MTFVDHRFVNHQDADPRHYFAALADMLISATKRQKSVDALQYIVDVTHKSLPVSAVTIVQLDDAGLFVERAARRKGGPRPPAAAVLTLAQRAVREEVIMVTDDVNSDPRVSGVARESDRLAAICAPLMIEGTPVAGVLLIEGSSSFEERTVEFVAAATAIATLTLQRAESHHG